MLDIKRIREDFDGVKKAVESRGKGDFGIDKVREYDLKRREILATVEKMKNEQKTERQPHPKPFRIILTGSRCILSCW